MSRTARLRIAIEVQGDPSRSGGVKHWLKGLVHALGKLDDGPEVYGIIVSTQEQLEWLKPQLGPNQVFVMKPGQRSGVPSRQMAPARSVRNLFRARPLRPLLAPARYVRNLFRGRSQVMPMVPVSAGYYESLGYDVIHFPTQHFVTCELPTVYNPHDLQHLHFPQFYTPSVIEWRQNVYRAGCRFAHEVVVGSQWVKHDVIRQYRINPDKVAVIPEAPPTQCYSEPTREDCTAVQNKYRLEQPFALYPAVTQPHKNHIRLLEALAYLRDSRQMIIRLVCTGSHDEKFWPSVEARISQLNLEPQVRMLGFVPEGDLRAIYRLSQLLVMPTLFEACSLPIFEAWLEGVPVACSNVTALPEQVMDAALLFDPHDVGSIAKAIAKVATNAELQEALRQRGYQRLKDFDWERTAKAYRAVYRRAAGHPLTEEDRWLLGWDWMREPQRIMGSR